PAHHGGAPRQAVCVHVHTDLPPRRGSSCGAGKYLALPRGRPTTGKRRTANRHGRDVAVVPQILRSRWGPNALAQKNRTHHRGSRPVANQREAPKPEERHQRGWGGGREGAGPKGHGGRRGPWA